MRSGEIAGIREYARHAPRRAAVGAHYSVRHDFKLQGKLAFDPDCELMDFADGAAFPEAWNRAAVPVEDGRTASFLRLASGR